MNDSTLDQELENALCVDPSPEFLARVRVRIAAEPSPKPAGHFWPFAAVGATAAVVFVVAVVLAPRSGPSAIPSSVSIAGSIESAAIVAPPAAAQTVRVARTRHEAVTTTRHDSDVVFSASEMDGLHRLIALASEGDAMLEALLAEPADPSSITDDELSEIVIAPVVIEPLVPDTY